MLAHLPAQAPRALPLVGLESSRFRIGLQIYFSISLDQTGLLIEETETIAAKAPKRADACELEAVELYLGDTTFARYWPFPLAG